MCSLIVLRGLDEQYPLVIAANRDERLERKASPPGSFLGQRRRLLSPRDRVAGGTWLAIDDRGRLAAVTNLLGEPPVPDAPSRGHLPHLVLDHDDLEQGLVAVRARLKEHLHSGFQLVVADRHRVHVLRHAKGQLTAIEWRESVLTISNEHAAGELQLRGLASALHPGLPIGNRLDALAKVLCDRGDSNHHAVLKRGEHYGTVSSSVVAVPRHDLGNLIWRFAPGPPDVTAWRNYGNLGARLQG